MIQARPTSTTPEGRTADRLATLERIVRNLNKSRDVGGEGVPGEDGNSFRSGTGAPSSGLGMDGDFYLDLSTWNLYGPKTGGSWGGATNIRTYSAGDGVDITGGTVEVDNTVFRRSSLSGGAIQMIDTRVYHSASSGGDDAVYVLRNDGGGAFALELMHSLGGSLVWLHSEDPQENTPAIILTGYDTFVDLDDEARIINTPYPELPHEVATKEYVDDNAGGGGNIDGGAAATVYSSTFTIDGGSA